MKKDFIVSVSILFFLLNFSLAQEVILRLPWGKASQAIGTRHTPEGLYGPQSFRIENGNTQILDNGNSLIKIFKEGRLLRVLPAAAACRDFVLLDNFEYALTIDNKTLLFRQGKEISEFGPSGKKVVQALRKTRDNHLSIDFSDGSSLTYQTQTKNKILRKGHLLNNDERILVLRKTAGLAEVDVFSKEGKLKRYFELNFQDNNLASLQVVGRDGQGNLFIHSELFESQVPLKVQRRVFVLDSLGQKLVEFKIPINNYAQIQHDLFVDSQGRLYQLLSGKQGLRILKWELPQKGPGSNPRIIEYPQEFDGLNYQQEAAPELLEAEEAQNPSPLEINVLPSVTPEKALEIGDRYVQLHWTCSSKNLTNGVITDAYGNHVETPDWLYVGNVQRVPYKWGGFNTLQGFLDGISGGKYAGDKSTDSVSPFAVGVDCSGFVSRCWTLPSHYSTRAMPDITQVYDNWDLTRPGDACHKVGHVRLIVGHEPNGTLDMVEAAGFNWRVSYTNYRYSQITSYMPRYYINMEGTPGNIPQPTLLSVLKKGPVNIEWQVSSKEAIYEMQINASADGKGWSNPKTLPDTSNYFRQELDDGQARYYYMCSIAASDQSSVGTPSDTYGIFNKASGDKVLIVDGFDRTAATGGSWPHTYHSFAVTHGRALEHFGIPFETVANETVINGTVSLNDYAAVFWILGDESTYDETFSSAEQTLVSTYLKQGGMLFVSGSEVGWDLDHKGSSSDKEFYHNFLKAVYKEDDSNSYSVNGMPATPFSGLRLHYDDGSHGVYQEDYPDVINTVNGSQVALDYANGKIAAVYFSGIFPGGSKEGRLFYMGFPFETIYNENERNNLMGNVLRFFGFEVTAIGRQPVATRIGSFKLFGNYPNPFNNQTIIRFNLPVPGRIKMNVYNVLGQRVLSFAKTYAQKGRQQIALNASGLSSGKYFYRLIFSDHAKQYAKSGQFILLK